MSVALIDADSIYFKAACVAKKDKDIEWYINSTMRSIDAACIMPGLTYVAVKGFGNFRKDLYPEYKANRPPIEEELSSKLNYGFNYMLDKYDAVMADGMEADDLVSIWASEAREAELQYIVVGMDKDLLQIPGNHYNFNTKKHEFIDDDMANYNLMVQCLTGDSGDNIPGIRGIGPKKAQGILQGVPMDRRWDRVRAAYRKHSGGDPNLSHRLLSMIKSWDEFEEVRKECEQKKTGDLTRGKSPSESSVNPSVSTQPTSESEEVT